MFFLPFIQQFFFRRLSGGLFLLVLAYLACLNLSGCYLLKQGRYLLHYNRRAQEIDLLLADTTLDESTRRFLELSCQIRKFAIDSINLHANDNYTKYVDIDRNYIIDAVNGAKKESFRQYLWRFPFFGAFPYKGFFERADAEREAGKLRRKNYDVHIRNVDAFSTLGFFTDPLYSYMKHFPVFSLASLIIHEQTHATIFLRNNTQFNEEIASFVGNEGARWFIRSAYGTDSEEYLFATSFIEDYRRFINYLRILYGTLDSVYKNDGIELSGKLLLKEQIIRQHQEEFKINYDELFMTQHFRAFATRDVNNAYLTSYMTYTRDLSVFYRLYERNNNDLRATVAQLTGLKRARGDPKEFIINNLMPRVETGNGE